MLLRGRGRGGSAGSPERPGLILLDNMIVGSGGGLAHNEPTRPGSGPLSMDSQRVFDHDETLGWALGPASGHSAMITIELFGVPRLRAGTGLVSMEAVDVGSALL